MDLLPPAASVLLSAAAVAACVVPARRIARASGYVAHPRADRFHTTSVPLLGGPVCLVGVALAVLPWIELPPAGGAIPLLDGGALPAALLGAAGFLILGLIDDRRQLSPLGKAIAEGAVLGAVLLVWAPRGSLGSVGAAAIGWISMMVVVNGWNYLDHADGVFASTAAVASVVLALVWGPTIGSGPFLGILFGVAGAMVGFLLWNLPPARIFLGDAGSLPLGFLLVFASLAILDAGPREAYPAAAAAHAIPVADLLLVTAVRLGAGRNPFRGGREHSGHRLVSVLGPTRALLLLVSVAASVGGVGILYGRRHPLPVLFALPVLVLLLVLGLSRISLPRRPESAPARRRRRGDRRSRNR